ncbi:hypothetical protein PP175_03050 [Aneurinibacillus sp. Ricciae_BoGa-3]|uniref:hypothetical protein n=1 Tax=Aneurinibacillus sp. Ricciae_BoGa-3 TaxID=3022697 RepID=UPI0023412531|nr:hypothetical protein [Aneurinibacillus sp. Ricciae_BoGa-3]WCK54990.1 hypothetical protein PP175_03050 [Aneurinibacillus sp. Ricciae_BoGa-3]
MEKNKNKNIILTEEAGYRDIYLRRPFVLKLVESAVYIVVMLGLLQLFRSDRTTGIVAATAAALAIVGFAPAIYKAVLHPVYQITRTELVIRMFNKEIRLPLQDLERKNMWSSVYTAQGKKHTIMASRRFMNELDEQIAKRQKGGRR